MNAKIIKKNGLFGILLGVGLYSLFSSIKQSPSMPSVYNIARSAIAIFLSDKFYSNLMYTIRIVVTGVFIAFLIGFSLGVLCSAFEVFNILIMPLMNIIKNIPSVALFPLFIVLMGIGDISRISVIVWNSLYAILSSTLAGVSSIEKGIIEGAQALGFNRRQIYIYIRIPLAMIDILNGVKIALGNAFIAIVVAEMLGATKGIGYMVLWSSNAFKYSDMYVYILVIALIGFSINALIEKIIQCTKRRLHYEKI